jgi:hypothetical protein
VAILGYWFFQDLIGGLNSLGNPYAGVAFWAHVGGFLMGVVACWLLNYGPDALRDKNRHVAENYLERPFGFGKGIEAAIRLLVRKDLKEACEIFREYWGKYLTVLEPEPQLSLTRQLIHDGQFDFSAKTLEVLIDNHRGEDPLLEKAFLMLARLYREKLDAPQKAESVYEQFIQKFPNSDWMAVAQKEYEEVVRKWDGSSKKVIQEQVGRFCSLP